MRKATLAQTAKLLTKLASGEIDGPTIQAVIEGKFRIIHEGSDEFVGGYRDNAAAVSLAKVGEINLRVQAMVLWDKGWGRELGFEYFEAYLATIPRIPELLLAEDERFPDLILVDARVTLTAACRLAGLGFSGDGRIFVDYDPKEKRTESVYWTRIQDGRKNRNKSVTDCRASFASDELGLTAMEGVAFYAQNPEIIRDHSLELPGSVHRDDNEYFYFAVLGDESGVPRLDRSWCGYARPGYGSASRRK